MSALKLFRQVSLYVCVFVFVFGQQPSVQNIFKITPKSFAFPNFHQNSYQNSTEIGKNVTENILNENIITEINRTEIFRT